MEQYDKYVQIQLQISVEIFWNVSKYIWNDNVFPPCSVIRPFMKGLHT